MKRRQKSGARRPAAAEVDTVAQLHQLQVRDEVTAKGYLLLVDESTHTAEVQNRGKKEAKSVCNLLVADGSGMIQVTVWAEKAEQVHPAASQWLQRAPDGDFPSVVWVAGSAIPQQDRAEVDAPADDSPEQDHTHRRDRNHCHPPTPDGAVTRRPRVARARGNDLCSRNHREYEGVGVQSG